MSAFSKKIFKEYLIPTYRKIGPIFVKGKGSFLWDYRGKKYLDLFPGWGVLILGHSHPRILKVINNQIKRLTHLPNNLFFLNQAVLAEKIIRKSFPGKVFFANSGAEAVEAAIKFTRLYGRKTKRFEIITMKNSFHGRTFGALSATAQRKYKDLFKPLLPKFIETRFNDFNDFKKKVTKRCVGVILELIQGEGGVNVSSWEYIKKLAKFCKDNDILLIIDEIQTGMGRTAKLFCYCHYGIKPDIMLLSKGLGAGIPISCMVVRKDIADIMGEGLHASTFGGNPLSCSVSLEVFKIIEEENILSNVEKLSKYLFQRLFEFRERFSIIKEVRGKGLMIGIELKCEAFPIFLKAFKKGLIINSTHYNVLRIMPALNVKKEELDRGLEILEEVFKSLC